MTRLPYLAAVVVVITYEAVAVKTKRAPTITRLIHEARRHFQPPCPQCGAGRRPPYRGWHTARVS